MGAIFSPRNVSADTTLFSRSLKVGMTGEDVRQLQKILNISSDTQIAEVGPGSPGQETAYFGPMTALAVIHFQEKYATEILIPNNLSAGTGFVGMSTRSVLTRLAQVAATKSPSIDTQYTPVQLPSTSQANITPSVVVTNPNEKNLDTFLSSVDTVAQKKGISADLLATIKDQIRKDIATSTNLLDAFEKTVKKSTITKVQTPTFVQKYFQDAWRALQMSFFPKHAQAAAGVPFGGAILFPFYCSCSANWLITITPLSPTFVTLLSYEQGSQAFLSYNLPFARWILGDYLPGAGICLIYVGTGCASVPSEGMVTPFVGSSPI